MSFMLCFMSHICLSLLEIGGDEYRYCTANKIWIVFRWHQLWLHRCIYRIPGLRAITGETGPSILLAMKCQAFILLIYRYHSVFVN